MVSPFHNLGSRVEVFGIANDDRQAYRLLVTVDVGLLEQTVAAA